MANKDNNNLLIGIIVIVALVLLFGFSGFSGTTGWCRGMTGGYGMMGGYGLGAMLFGWLTGTLVIILIVAAIYWLIKSANKK